MKDCLGGVPPEQKMLKEHLPRVKYHLVYEDYKDILSTVPRRPEGLATVASVGESGPLRAVHLSRHTWASAVLSVRVHPPRQSVGGGKFNEKRRYLRF